MEILKKVAFGVGKFIRRHWIICLVLFLLLYLIIGALAPFLHYKKLSGDFANSWSAESVLEPENSPDRAMILETNMSAWEERIRLINMAKERIILSSFDIRDGESTRDIMAMLLHKADEGVDIRILVDGFSGFLRMERNNMFYAVSSHPNIEIRIYNPIQPWFPWTTQGRMHDKYVICDEQAYILGGRNTFDYFIGNYETDGRSFDREMLIYNTAPPRYVSEDGSAPDTENDSTMPGAGAVANGQTASSLYEVEAYFNSVWTMDVCKPFHDDEKLRSKEKVKEQIAFLNQRYDTLAADFPELFEPYDYMAATKPTDGVHLISGPTTIYGKEPQVFYMLTELMKQANDKVIIHTPYIVCNDYMYDALTQVNTSVPDVRMMINSVANGDNVVASSDYLKNKKNVIETGITIYEYDGGTSYHGKSVVIDDYVSIVGSYNMDLRSTYMDTELMLLVKSKEITKELTGYMDIMQNDSRKVLDAKAYETPDHIVVADIPLGKRIAFKILGILLAPFRCVI